MSVSQHDLNRFREHNVGAKCAHCKRPVSTAKTIWWRLRSAFYCNKTECQETYKVEVRDSQNAA